jgi:hypothetical protein
MSRRQARGAAVVAGVLLLLALWLGIAPVKPPAPAPRPLPPLSAIQASSSSGPRQDPALYREVVQGNILSPSRTAPAPREALRPGAGAAGSSGDGPRRRLRLSGIVRGPEGVVALIDADPAVPGAELYRQGDRVGPYRLVEATDSVIVLRGASGTQVLRLDPLPGGRTP